MRVKGGKHGPEWAQNLLATIELRTANVNEGQRRLLLSCTRSGKIRTPTPQVAVNQAATLTVYARSV